MGLFLFINFGIKIAVFKICRLLIYKKEEWVDEKRKPIWNP